MAVTLLALLGLAMVAWFRRLLAGWARTLRSDPQARLDALAVLAVCLVGLSVRLWGLDAAGQTWDEDVYFGAGRNYWLNLLSFDVRPASWAWNLEHPPVTKYVVGLGALWSEALWAPRALSALMGGATASLVYLVGRDWFADRRVGLLSAVLVGLMPSLVAHGRVAGHEAPSVFLYTLTILLAGRGLRGATPRWSAVAWAGLCFGLAVGARLINVTVLLVVLAMAACVAVTRYRDRLPTFDRVNHVVVLVLLGLLTFLLAWPRLWHHPLYHLGELLSYWPPGAEPAELFLGTPVTFSWAYFPVYAAVTTPTAVLVGFALFGARLFRHRERAELVLLAWILAPLLVTPLVPFCRDGVRYVLPIAVPLALASSVGVIWAADALLGRLLKKGPCTRGSPWASPSSCWRAPWPGPPGVFSPISSTTTTSCRAGRARRWSGGGTSSRGGVRGWATACASSTATDRATPPSAWTSRRGTPWCPSRTCGPPTSAPALGPPTCSSVATGYAGCGINVGAGGTTRRATGWCTRSAWWGCPSCGFTGAWIPERPACKPSDPWLVCAGGTRSGARGCGGACSAGREDLLPGRARQRHHPRVTNPTLRGDGVELLS